MDTWIGFTFWILCSEHGCTNIFKLAFSSFGYIPRSKIARLGINSMFCFFFKKKHIAILFSTATVPFYIPNNSVQGFQFLHIFFNICYILSFFFFESRHPSGHEVVAHCDFHLHFRLLEKSPLPIFNQIGCFCCCYCWIVGVPYIVWILAPCQIYDWQIFSPILWLAFSLLAASQDMWDWIEPIPPCIGSTESLPLDHQRSPWLFTLDCVLWCTNF